jgi:hypothetical protein
MSLRPTPPLLLSIALLLASSPAAAQVSQRKLGSFQTPSGNIHCEEWEVGSRGRTELRCDVLEFSNARPKPPKDCELDYGYAFMLKARGPGWLLCGGDTIADPAHVRVKYGEVWRGTGGVSCDATPARLRCLNRDRHGFELSKREQRLL